MAAEDTEKKEEMAEDVEKKEEDEAKRLFARNLNYFLELHEKRQADLAKYIGCGTSLVSSWCSGKKMPRMDKLKAICDFFHIELSDLLDDKAKLQEEGYYMDEKTKQIAQELSRNPDMCSLFDVSRNIPPERLRAHIEFMKKLQEIEPKE